MAVALAGLVILLPYLLAALSVAYTVGHTIDEVSSEPQTIWEYLADVYPWFPRLGYLAGSLLLAAFAATQMALAGAGFAGGDRAALWALLTIRLGDFTVSHWLPWLRGRRPNPGLMSSPLYAIDAAFAVAVLTGGLY